MTPLPRHGMPRKRATKKTLKHNDADDANQSWAFHKGFGDMVRLLSFSRMILLLPVEF